MALVTSAPSHLVVPFHRPVNFAAPRSLISTDSKSMSWVQSRPSASGVTPLAFSLSKSAMKASSVVAFLVIPALARTVLLPQITLARWMFAGTE